MKEKFGIIQLAQSAISTVDTEGPESIDVVRDDEVNYLNRFVSEQVGGEMAGHCTERISNLMNSEYGIVVADWYGHSSWAIGIAGIVAGEKIDDTLTISDLILNKARQGAGSRAKKLLAHIASVAEVSEISVVCTEDDKQFLRELIPNGQFKEPDFENQKHLLFNVRVEDLQG